MAVRWWKFFFFGFLSETSPQASPQALSARAGTSVFFFCTEFFFWCFDLSTHSTISMMIRGAVFFFGGGGRVVVVVFFWCVFLGDSPALPLQQQVPQKKTRPKKNTGIPPNTPHTHTDKKKKPNKSGYFFFPIGNPIL